MRGLADHVEFEETGKSTQDVNIQCDMATNMQVLLYAEQLEPTSGRKAWMIRHGKRVKNQMKEILPCVYIYCWLTLKDKFTKQKKQKM